MLNTDRVLVAPITTEKTVATPGKYAFRVHSDANKDLVKKAVKQHYGVDVEAVNMINLPNKLRVTPKRSVVRRRVAYKKAIVTLKSGQTLNFNDFK